MDPTCTDVDRLMNRYYLPVTYSIIFIVGLLGNLTSISIYVTKLRPWKSSTILMVNLALADLLYVLSLPFLVYYYTNEESWLLGDFLCRFVRAGFHFNLYGSILFLTCLAVFRYVVVMKPLRAAQVQQKFWGVAACSAVWIVAAVEVTPMLTMISLEVRDNKTSCSDFASTISDDGMQWYGWLLTALGFLLPLVVVFMCCVGIVRQLGKGPKISSPSRMRARRVTVLILVVFVLCFLPYHILRALRVEIRGTATCTVERTVHAAYIVSRPLAGLNTFFNLALYTFSGDKFRRAFLSAFHWEHWLQKAKSVLQVSVISKAADDVPAA